MMARPRRDAPRGLLNLHLAEDRVRLARYLPSAPLDACVEHYWTVHWDLRGQPPFTSQTLPYPSVHLVLEQGDWHLTGVPTTRFERTLHDEGAVFGIKFLPGGFRPFVDTSVSTFTDRVLLGRDVLAWVAALPCDRSATDAEIAQGVEAVLLAHVPASDPHIAMVNRLVDAIADNREIVRVEQVVALSGLGQRALQRLFREYVGVTPKWVIQRYRLLEAADRLATGETDGARVAQELGYFDQAHFIRDFKAIVGRSPGAFVAARTVANGTPRPTQS